MTLTNKPNSQYTMQTAQLFADSHALQNTRILIYRDLETLLKKHSCQGNALDFGCGPGISTRYLANLGFTVTGVDINRDMILCAFKQPDGIPFAWIEHGKLPFRDKTFDLVIAIMVLLEEPSLDMMSRSLCEIWRVLKPDGIFLSVVASEHLHKHNWLNRTVADVENNHNLKTGDSYTTHSRVSGMSFTNFVYLDDDYRNAFQQANFKIIDIHHALGNKSDNIDWQLETKLNPFTHYVCQKS